MPVRGGASVTRLTLAAFAIALGVPLVPAFQSSSERQAVLITIGLIVCTMALGSLARTAGVAVARSILIGATPVALAFTSVISGSNSPDRFVFALLLGSLLTFGTLAGAIATDDDRDDIMLGLTAIAIVAGAMAIVEWVNKAPIYEFTAFQSSENQAVIFRASSIFGHPLILATFMSAVGWANFARGSRSGPWWIRNRLISVGVPLVAAVASQSRSIVLVAGVCILATLVAKQVGAKVSKTTTALTTIGAAAAIAYSLSSGTDGLSQRFGTLTFQEQTVRLNGLTVVTDLTNGIETVIGAGPRAVAAEYITGAGVVTFGTVDNQFLTMFADYGLIGLGLLVALVLVPVRALRIAPVSREAFPFVVAALAVATSMVVLDPLAWPVLGLLFAFGVGTAGSAKKTVTSARRPVRTR